MIKIQTLNVTGAELPNFGGQYVEIEVVNYGYVVYAGRAERRDTNDKTWKGLYKDAIEAGDIDIPDDSTYKWIATDEGGDVYTYRAESSCEGRDTTFGDGGIYCDVGEINTDLNWRESKMLISEITG
jgi:hypothetical protein